jgi:DNA processing protein
MHRAMSARIDLDKPPYLLSPDDPTWPPGLHDLKDMPAALRVAGHVPGLSDAVAIVGTRSANEEALRFTRRLARDLASAGFVIVSGGADGIDAAAHLGALAGGGRTVAILATGVIDAYPRHHAALFAEIARSGALVCEHEHRPCAQRALFLRRNRLIAAIAKQVVIVQAPSKSGALSTARWARTLHRPLWVVPASPWDERGQGCVEMLRKGAGICTSAGDILSVTPSGSPSPLRTGSKRSRKVHDSHSLEAPLRDVWQVVRQGAGHPDEIAAALDMPAAEVQEALLNLMLRGLCRQCADGNYVSNDS